MTTREDAGPSPSTECAVANRNRPGLETPRAGMYWRMAAPANSMTAAGASVR